MAVIIARPMIIFINVIIERLPENTLREQDSHFNQLSGSRFAYMLGVRSDAYFMYVNDEQRSR